MGTLQTQGASLSAAWSVGGLGLIALFVGLIGYIVANRLRSLHRYRRMILVVGVLLFLVSIYVNRKDVMAGFMEGWNAAQSNR